MLWLYLQNSNEGGCLDRASKDHGHWTVITVHSLFIRSVTVVLFFILIILNLDIIPILFFMLSVETDKIEDMHMQHFRSDYILLASSYASRRSLKSCQDIRFTASCDICQFKTLRVPTLKTHICWRPECSYKATAKNHQQLQQDKKTDSRIGNTRGLW